ncbi:MAG: hypothetical protein NC203_04560 [Firmicutes bacterium]|nr:hypothetical protein [[Eubacterium] siraeum]MCM1487623.1 hypothetical protein [Bacillota bacterium]
MQRKPFWKLLLLGVGYMALGNVMCTIMTVAASVVANVAAILIILFILTLFIFYSLCFTVAFKDGQRERLMVKNHRVEGIIKGRWIRIGLAMFLIMSIPSAILFADAAIGLFDGYLIPYRMICGMIYPLALVIGVNHADITQMSPICALIFAACYILIPVATQMGFDAGFKDKLNPDKIIYEQK